jgi:serine protease AprX
MDMTEKKKHRLEQKQLLNRMHRLHRHQKNPLEHRDPSREKYRDMLLSTVIAIPLLEAIRRNPETKIYDILIDLNLDSLGSRDAAKKKVKRLIRELVRKQPGVGWSRLKDDYSAQYVFAKLTGAMIRKLVEMDQSQEFVKGDMEGSLVVSERDAANAERERYVVTDEDRSRPRHTSKDCAIYHIWPDFEVRPLISRSIATIKADAAQKSFSAFGRGIVWAVMDSGIDETHPHFANGTLDLPLPLKHRDFTVLEEGGAEEMTEEEIRKLREKLQASEKPLVDARGHGTHVAGIIAGSMLGQAPPQKPPQKKKDEPALPAICAAYDQFSEQGTKKKKLEFLTAVTGIAPECKLVSLKVLNDNGGGPVSNLIAALTYIQEINGYGRRLLIHGVNMSVGYDFNPEWFACGQSPLCIEVNRLVRSGVVVVVAAGNTGYVYQSTAARGRVAAGANLTINDPGNAEGAITVGATHRDMPHIYGVSYFSSKGPTGDGRLKPDLLAPGEKILSCASAQSPKFTEAVTTYGAEVDTFKFPKVGWYVPDSGTSMAAPHVSGAIAAFLSIRREFIGQPDQVKRIFIQSATDLGRERYFQGNGLVDLMRAIQSV